MNASEKIRKYERSIRTGHHADIDTAMVQCAASGDGNYRVTLDTDAPFPERGDNGYGKPTGRMIRPTHSIEVRDGVARYV